jgi:hypothetical protein
MDDREYNENWDKEWLTNDNFIFEYEGPYRDYMEKLRNHLRTFAYEKPVPANFYWSRRTNKEIRVAVGKNSELFYVDPFMAVYDFAHKIERVFLRNFYPMWEVEDIKKRPPTTREVQEYIRSGIPAHTAVKTLVEDKAREHGVIEKIWMREDKFQININGHRSIRSTAFYMPISQFLPQIRKIETDEGLRNFVMGNSEEVVETIKSRPIEITYDDERMMMNFFQENKYDLYGEEFTEEVPGEGWWSWGPRYRIFFQDDNFRKKCQLIINDYRRSVA